MQRRFLPILIILLLIAAIAALAWPRPAGSVQAGIVGLTADYSSRAQDINRSSGEESGTVEGFTRADGSRALTFPADFGPHPDFQTEWWYYTGNLQTADGRRFGYQLTFFRRAALPLGERQARESAWAVEQLYLAHFTLTDVDGGRFRAFERLERGAAGLAGAEIDPSFRVWLRDWSVEQSADGRYQLRANAEEVAIDLTLTDGKGPILQGDQGLSQKGPQAGNASYYFSQTRLQSEGQVQVAEQEYTVIGLSWMDREFSTSALSEDQVGWDWFSIQLDDGSEIMLYQIRRADGSADPFSSGTFIAPDGTTSPIKLEEMEITAQSTWTSPHTQGKYPSRWQVRVPSLGITLQVEPLLADQELNLSYSYWEGAVRVTGERQGKTVSGYGYVELTGYAKALEGV